MGPLENIWLEFQVFTVFRHTSQMISPCKSTVFSSQFWVGSVTEISMDDLSAEDVDTPPKLLEFIVTPPSNGYLALRSFPSKHILNFTQSHIENGQLVFVHSGETPKNSRDGSTKFLVVMLWRSLFLLILGALSGGFHFQVNDGVNFAPRQIFSTTAHSLVLTLERNRPLEVYPGVSICLECYILLNRVYIFFNTFV